MHDTLFFAFFNVFIEWKKCIQYHKSNFVLIHVCIGEDVYKLWKLCPVRLFIGDRSGRVVVRFSSSVVVGGLLQGKLFRTYLLSNLLFSCDNLTFYPYAHPSVTYEPTYCVWFDMNKAELDVKQIKSINY